MFRNAFVFIFCMLIFDSSGRTCFLCLKRGMSEVEEEKYEKKEPEYKVDIIV